MLINITINEQNIITEWAKVPFDYNKPVLDVENISTIHIGYSQAINPIIVNNEDKTYTLYTLLENKEEYEESKIKAQELKKKKLYDTLVSKYVREKYTQDKVEAIINNYLSDTTNTNYIVEFQDLQSYRKQCKQRAYSEAYEN